MLFFIPNSFPNAKFYQKTRIRNGSSFGVQVIAEKPQTLSDPFPGCPVLEANLADRETASFGLIQPEDGPQHLGPARADQSRNPQDLSLVKGQVNFGRHPPPFETVQGKNGLARGVGDTREKPPAFPADQTFTTAQ